MEKIINLIMMALFNEIKANKKGFYSKYEYEYNTHNGEVLFFCKWRY